MSGIFDPGIFDSGIFDTPSGGSSVTRTTTDSLTSSESLTRTAVLSRSTTDAPTTNDAAVRVLNPRTTTDSPTTADVATRVGSFHEAATDSPTTSDSATRNGSFHKTTADAPTTSDSVVRLSGKTRTATDVPTTSDSPSRVASVLRSTTDAPHTSDVAERGLIARTATDSVTANVSAGRALIANRATADFAVMTESASTNRLYRTVTESISTSEAVSTTRPSRTVTQSLATAGVATRAVVLSRSTSESVAASLAAIAIKNQVIRSVTDHITSSDTASLSGSLTRTTADAVSADQVAISHPTPYLPGPVVYIDGINVTKATGDPMLFASARFMSAVNGVAGTASFRVRDDLGNVTYTPGQSLELIIDGLRVWTGFVSSVKRVYAFPALNVTEFGPTRFFDIEGVDLNILFSRRIVFNQTTPADVLAPLYGPHTPDVTVIGDLFADWIDLTGDGLDTSTGVTAVATINEDQNARPWEGSDTWGQAMQSISALPASIYYIRPNWEFAYVDTDTPDAPFGLSDVPDGVTTKGYREVEILMDGTNLANDVFAWGVGYGSNAPVVSHISDSDSTSAHGLWQLGQTTFGVYKQDTIDRIADSILNGSPEHRRGAKDDREAVTLVTYEGGLLPAQKVDFHSEVFGFEDVIPIRKMEVTFPAPDKPRYELLLSHEIDAPWSFFDPYRFKLPHLPSLPAFPPFPPIHLPEMPGVCTPYVSDTFTRAEGSGWGDADSGQHWTVSGVNSSSRVSGGQGVLVAAGSDANGDITVSLLDVTIQNPTELYVTNVVILPDFTNPGAPHLAKWHVYLNDGGSGRAELQWGGSDNSWGIRASQLDSFTTFSPPVDADAGDIFNVHMHWDGSDLSVNVWLSANAEPTGFQQSVALFGTSLNWPSIRLFHSTEGAAEAVDAFHGGYELCSTNGSTLPAGPAYGPFNELVTRIDETHYQLSRTMTTGTLRLSVGSPGKLLTQDSDYTVNPTTAIVTLTNPITDPATPVQATYTAAGPLPPVFATGAIAQFPGTGPSTEAAFSNLCSDMNIDIIEIAAGTYHFRNCHIEVDRSSRPLTIRPAAGAAVVFSAAGDGQYGDAAFYGFTSRTSYITFDGSTGSMSFQHYLLAQEGVFLFQIADHMTFRNMSFSHIAANARGGQQSSHCFYISHGCHDFTFENITIAHLLVSDEAGASAGANGFHFYTGGLGASVYNVTVRNSSVANAGWAMVTRNGTTGIVVDGLTATDCGHGVPAAVDFGFDNTGTFTNSSSSSSIGTPLIQGAMTDGGGNGPWT